MRAETGEWMAGSRKKSTVGPKTLYHLRDLIAAPDRTPGPLGINDAGDPTRLSLLGDTPGPVGQNDGASTERYVLPGTKTLHEWSAEVRVHTPPDQQIGQFYPAGGAKEVLDRAVEFLVKEELLVDYVYIPGVKSDGSGAPIAYSGITLGVGYDLGQHSEAEIRRDWAEINSYTQPVSVVSSKGHSLGLPKLQVDPAIANADPPLTLDALKKGSSSLKLSLDPKWTSTLDLLARGARLQRQQAVNYFPEVKYLSIPKALSLKVFKDSSLAETYKKSLKFFPGLEKLPTGAQVALLSLVYNSGLTHGKKEKKVKYYAGEEPIGSPPPSMSLGLHLKHGEFSPAVKEKGLNRDLFGVGPLVLDSSKTAKPEPKAEPQAATKKYDDDIFGGDWEKRMLQQSVLTRDLVWIYWYFESARRIFPDDPGLVKRREYEADLILPYVWADLHHEAFMQSYRNLH
jgi:hypothetical protein